MAYQVQYESARVAPGGLQHRIGLSKVMYRWLVNPRTSVVLPTLARAGNHITTGISMRAVFT